LARQDQPRSDVQGAVLIVGLGRFGIAVADALVRLGHEVLVVDQNADLVRKWAQEFTHVVEADATDEETLRQLGVDSFGHAVVAIGTDIEASVLSVLALTEVGIADVWAKAVSHKHGQILQRVGAQHVIFPESDMGERVAHLVTGTMLDYIEFEDGFAIARTKAPREAFNRTLADSALRTKYGITVVGIKRRGVDFIYARPETKVGERDELIVAGPTDEVEKFSTVASYRRWS
jgi:trk system potassium uptake protein